MTNIPFVKPFINKSDLISAINSIDINNFGGLGPISSKLEKYFEKTLKVKKALMVGSCTDALEISLYALDLQKNDEIICPGYTFVSPINSIIKAGGKAIFVDIEEKTFGLNPKLVEKAINNKTKAVLLVHYGGIPARVEDIKRICEKYNLKLIEDAAQAFLVKKHNKFVGTFGDIGCFSFHNTKNITSGEGGLLVINRNNKKLINICEEIRSFGTNKDAFTRGEVNIYEWQRIGGSYFATDIEALLINIQLQKYKKILFHRRRVYKTYLKYLDELKICGVKLCDHPSNSNYHLFWILCRSKEEREILLKILKAKGVCSSSHFPTLHLSPFVRGNKKMFMLGSDLNISTSISEKILRLPIYPQLKENEIKYISLIILDFYKR